MNNYPTEQPEPAVHPVPFREPPPQPVAVAAPQPQPYPPPAVAQRSAPPEPDKPQPAQSLRIYSHSSLVYWWPVWAVGYVMAALTYWWGQPDFIGQSRELFHASSNLGVIFFLTLFLVILITNLSVRGLASGLVVMGVVLVTVVLAYLGWWDEILGWFGDLKIHLNLGAYFWFSTLMLVVWLVSVFLVDRMSYWQVTPGQVTHVSVFGSGSKSYDTNGMMLEKHREDFFRHWLLGLGSGDLQIRTSGATREQIDVPNVLFIGYKVDTMQRLIAVEPEASPD